jgi:lysozyme family protein
MGIFDDQALPLILIFEGGFTDDPADKGGATSHGIIQTEYNSYLNKKGLPPQSVKYISDIQVHDIYLNDYWLVAKCDKMPGNFSVAVFDTAVNNGVGRSTITLQRAIGAVPDGIIGPETLSKLAAMDVKTVGNKFLDAKIAFYNACVQHDSTQQKFLGGWLRRVQFVRDYINGVKNLAQIKATW